MFPLHHLIAGLIIGLIFFSVLTAVTLFIVVLMRRRRAAADETAPDPEKDSTVPSTAKVTADEDDENKADARRRYSWKEIEKMTGGFDPSAVIGEGGFSNVYLARLPGDDSSRRCAAVKVQRQRREFWQELDVLQGMRHDGVVRLLGYCDDRDECALVFEYVPDGNLHDRLHGDDAGQYKPPLPWSHRMSIAHQLGSALRYLHESCDPHVIHADIKPANILLDFSSSSCCRSVLCDFGSARTGFSSAVTQSAGGRCRHRGEKMVASPGYVDPHLVRTGVASRKSDVYSFGMVLMELVTGREAVGVDKRQVARAVEAGTVRDVVDGRLLGEEGEFNYDEAEAAAVAALAVRCVGDQPTLRPSMGEVVKILAVQVAGSIQDARAGGDGYYVKEKQAGDSLPTAAPHVTKDST